MEVKTSATSSTTASARTRCVLFALAVSPGPPLKRLTRLPASLFPRQSLLTTIRDVVESRGGKLLHIDELRQSGKTSPADLTKMPKRDDVFCIMYTSGSTGAPKGVILTHNNIICSLGATTTLLKDVVNQQDTFLAFLPLSHILEMLVELTFYTMGITVGYGGTKTLTDASVRNCSGDLKAYAPSIIVGVRASCCAVTAARLELASSLTAPFFLCL